MSTVIAKGSVVNNPSLNDIGRAHFVRCTATGGTQTIEIMEILLLLFVQKEEII